MSDKIELILNNEPIILQYSKQGIQGRRGAQGLQGDDAIGWEAAVKMEGVTSGTCTITLYQDGEVCEDIHYAEVYTMPTNSWSFSLSSSLSRTITGTYSFNYSDVRAIFVVVWEDSYEEKVLCTGQASMIRGRDIKILKCASLSYTNAVWQTYGAAGTTNTWTTGSSYDNSTIEDGDIILIPGTVSDETDGSGNLIECFILGTAEIDEGDDASSSVDVTSIGFFVGAAGSAATVTVGSVTTLAYGSSATVTNSGTSYAAVLDFGIPQGYPGTGASLWGQLYGTLSDQTDLQTELDAKQDTLTWDSTPTSGSTNPVTSGGVYTALASKANLASPTFTGTPAAPTASSGTNTTQLATTAFVQTAISSKADPTTFATFSSTSLTCKSNYCYRYATAITSLTITWPAAAVGVIFEVDFTSGSSFSGITHKNSSGTTISPKLVGDSTTLTGKRYNLICWYDGSYYWAAAKAA